jgi:hypothetical protein
VAFSIYQADNPNEFSSSILQSQRDSYVFLTQNKYFFKEFIPSPMARGILGINLQL